MAASEEIPKEIPKEIAKCLSTTCEKELRDLARKVQMDVLAELQRHLKEQTTKEGTDRLVNDLSECFENRRQVSIPVDSLPVASEDPNLLQSKRIASKGSSRGEDITNPTSSKRSSRGEDPLQTGHTPVYRSSSSSKEGSGKTTESPRAVAHLSSDGVVDFGGDPSFDAILFGSAETPDVHLSTTGGLEGQTSPCCSSSGRKVQIPTRLQFQMMRKTNAKRGSTRKQTRFRSQSSSHSVQIQGNSATEEGILVSPNSQSGVMQGPGGASVTGSLCTSKIRPSLSQHMEAMNAQRSNRESSQSRLAEFVRSERFDYAMSACVMLNAASICAKVQIVATGSDHFPESFKVIDGVALLVFSLELILRIRVYGPDFFKAWGWQWNWLDTLLVFAQFADFALLIASDELETLPPFASTIVRMLRFGKVVRLTRMLHLIPELKAIAYLICASLSSTFWTLVLLLLLMLSMAVYFTDVATEMRGHTSNEESTVALRLYWGSLETSIFSLVQAITGGEDWRHLQAPLSDGSSFQITAIVFVVYVAFCLLVMLNLVTGMFVDGAHTIVKEDREYYLIKLFLDIFMESSSNSTGQQLTQSDLVASLQRADMERALKEVDLSESDAQNLFMILDSSGTGLVDTLEFVQSCVHESGAARSIDLRIFMYNYFKQESHMNSLLLRLSSQISKLPSSQAESGLFSRNHGQISQATGYSMTSSGLGLDVDVNRSVSSCPPRTSHMSIPGALAW